MFAGQAFWISAFQRLMAHSVVSYHSEFQKLFQRIKYCMFILFIVNQVKKKHKQAPKPNIPMHHEKKIRDTKEN